MLRTQRLRLRPFQSEDTLALFGFMSDPVVMQFTYVAPSLPGCEVRLSAYEAMRSTLGFAPWVVLSEKEGTIIGWGGLSIDPNEPEWGLEVSYAFGPKYWGKGFATELVQFSLAYAFAVLSAEEVNSFAMPANAASIRVLQACGFQLLRYVSGLQRNHYRASAPSAATPR
jgi:ribosomal-protein-alanine N-acetyltransferase